jgi:hypothetical protein
MARLHVDTVAARWRGARAAAARDTERVVVEERTARGREGDRRAVR